MPNCVFCVRSAGPDEWEHRECRRRNEEGKGELRRLVFEAALGGRDLAVAALQAEHLARSCYIYPIEWAAILAESWSAALDHCVRHGRTTRPDLDRLREALRLLRIDRERLKVLGVPEKIRKFRRRPPRLAAMDCLARAVGGAARYASRTVPVLDHRRPTRGGGVLHVRGHWRSSRP